MKRKFSPKLIIAAVLILLLVGAVAVYLMGGKDKMGKNGVMQDGNAFTSIRDALSKSISLECELTDSEGRNTKAYIKNGAVRADMTDPDPNKSGSIIMKDKKIYIWNGSEGFVMDIPDESSATGESGSETTQGDQVLNDLENYKDNCKPAIVSDSLFTPPADVTFSDVQKMMEGQMNEAELEELMDKYGGSEGT